MRRKKSLDLFLFVTYPPHFYATIPLSSGRATTPRAPPDAPRAVTGGEEARSSLRIPPFSPCQRWAVVVSRPPPFLGSADAPSAFSMLFL